jgi:arsenite methyltransferase
MSTKTKHGAREEATRTSVQERYGRIASGGGCCSSTSAKGPAAESADGCCGGGCAADLAVEVGYSRAQLRDLPTGADLGLGCGNPTALLALEPGQIVLDLGSGAGIDCFLAAKRIGPKGRAIGVDMTPEMLAKARENARKGRYANVEFRLGEIEHLPVADRSVDRVISNCVINLAPDKEAVYREAFRVLRPGGRIAFSDVVATHPISRKDRADPSLWSACSSGALEVREVKRLLRKAGFREVRLDLRVPKTAPSSLAGPASRGVVSADIRATKPEE